MHNIRVKLSFLWKFFNRGPTLNKNTCNPKYDTFRTLSNFMQYEKEKPSWIDASDSNTLSDLTDSFVVYNDFITEEEESSLVNELEPYLRRLRYERDHWDDAIHGYRETERRQWNEENSSILQRVSDIAFPPPISKLAYVHILDLEKSGVIKPHIDAIRVLQKKLDKLGANVSLLKGIDKEIFSLHFCGNTIAGLSLLSTAVMRLTHDKDDSKRADILLTRRSLYIMRDNSRYLYKHAVLDENESAFMGQKIQRDRRVSVIMRNEPDKNISEN